MAIFFRFNTTEPNIKIYGVPPGPYKFNIIDDAGIAESYCI